MCQLAKPSPLTCVVRRVLAHLVMSETPWTLAHQASLSTGFPRQEYWSGLPFPSPRDLPDPGIEPASPVSAALPSGKRHAQG